MWAWTNLSRKKLSPLSPHGEKWHGPKIDLFQNIMISEHSAVKTMVWKENS